MIGACSAVLWVYILFAIALFVAPVVLRIYGEDTPRNDQDDGEPALVT